MRFSVVLFLTAFIIFLVIPVSAIEINPSVRNQPFFCQYSITKNTFLCDQEIRGPQGQQGIQGLPNFSAIYYNASNFTTSQNASTFVNATNFTSNSNYTVFEGGTFYNGSINESYAYLPGRPGGQTLTGGVSSSDALVLNGSQNGGDVILNPKNGSVITGNSSQLQTVLGYLAGFQNTGNYQTVVGTRAGQHNLGVSQTAFGSYAGWYNYAAAQTAIGRYAGQENTGIYQTVEGTYAGYQNSGTYHTAIGNNAGFRNAGNFQIAVGNNAGYGNAGTYQTAIGDYAGFQNTGNYQIGIGNSAGYGNTGSNVVFIGYQAGKNNTLANQFILIQTNVNSNPLISGNFSSGMVRFNNYGAGTATFDAGGNITSVSDEKYKTAIKPYTGALAAIKAIQPITFKYNAASGLDTQNEYTGFSAQNLKSAGLTEAVSAKDDVTYITEKQKIPIPVMGEDGKETIEYQEIEIAKEVKTGTQTLSVSDRAIIATLLNALKEEDAKNAALEKRIAALEEKLGVKP